MKFGELKFVELVFLARAESGDGLMFQFYGWPDEICVSGANTFPQFSFD